MTLHNLRTKREAVQKEFSKLDASVHNGNMTRDERDVYLREKFGSESEKHVLSVIDQKIAEYQDTDEFQHKIVYLITGFSIVIAALFATLLYSTGGITGAVIMEVNTIDVLFTDDNFLTVMLNETTRLNVSGLARGQGDVTLSLSTGKGTYVLYEYREGAVTTDHASLPKQRYEVGETVEFTAEMVSTSYLISGDDAILLGNQTSIENLSVGNYSIKLIINDSRLVQEELPFRVVEVGTPQPEERFNTCGEVCKTNLTGEAQLLVEIEGDASVNIDNIVLSSGGNQPPVQLAQIEDIETDSSVIIDLNSVFVDPDGDELMFETSHHALTDETIQDGILTITGETGTYGFIIYASDMVELVPSNTFSVTFTEVNNTIAVNDTVNLTENVTVEINVTVNDTTVNLTNNNLSVNLSETNISVNVTTQTIGCDYPDVNMRPLECLQNESDKYFQDQTIIITNTDRQTVARITPIGNLLIQGNALETSQFTAPNTDYTIGYEDEYGNYVSTVWFDSETGNIYLKGYLYEENANLKPTPGSFLLRNKKGISLMWANPTTGDLYVRGNLIPYRRSLE